MQTTTPPRHIGLIARFPAGYANRHERRARLASVRATRRLRPAKPWSIVWHIIRDRARLIVMARAAGEEG